MGNRAPPARVVLTMKHGLVALAALTLAACRVSGTPGLAEARAEERVADAAPGSAVVELFTSEGCSSCPPADAVLADLARRNPAVCALEFHVDYWDDLGWPDPFASPDFTARQLSYAQALRTRGMFTPQMVVNGTDSFTGSDRAHADGSVTRALARPAAVPLSIKARPFDSRSLIVEYRAPNVSSNAMIDVAIVEHSASTDVRAGENAGRRLLHSNVVRALTVAPLRQAAGTTVVPLPPTLHREIAEVIAFVQLSDTSGSGMPVLGCARSAIP
jgi:hypothetical protein